MLSANYQGVEKAMTDDEKRAKPQARLKYEEGLKRIYVVLVVCWVAFLLRFPVAGDPSGRTEECEFTWFLGAPIPPTRQ